MPIYNLLQNNSIKIWSRLFKDGNIFVNSKNSETNEPHRFTLDLQNKLDLKDLKKDLTLGILNIYYI